MLTMEGGNEWKVFPQWAMESRWVAALKSQKIVADSKKLVELLIGALSEAEIKGISADKMGD